MKRPCFHINVISSSRTKNVIKLVSYATVQPPLFSRSRSGLAPPNAPARPVSHQSYDIMRSLIRHLYCFEMKAHQFHGLRCPADDLWALLCFEIAPENGCRMTTGVGDGEFGGGTPGGIGCACDRWETRARLENDSMQGTIIRMFFFHYRPKQRWK